MMNTIYHNNEMIALIIPSDFEKEGLEFFTPDDFSQQLAYMKHPKGKQIEPHVHNLVMREVQFTQEVLIVKSGKVRVDLFTNKKEYLESVILTDGDIILLASGGHGFEMLEETQMIEVKQGPYAGDEDKTRFQNNIQQLKIK